MLLRLNCEGIEDDVIYAAHSSFQDKLKLICGSLKDVEGVKGLGPKKLPKIVPSINLPIIDEFGHLRTHRKKFYILSIF